MLHNIGLPLQFHTDLSQEEIWTRVREIGGRLQLEDQIYGLQPFELNDVQTRMVTLARALITRPRLLLVDELEGGMSEEFLAATMETLRAFQREEPLPIIMTTASDVVLEAADRTFSIENCDLLPFELTA